MPKTNYRGGHIALRRVGDKDWKLFTKQEAVAAFLNVSRPMVSLALYGKFKKTGNILMGYEIVYIQKEALK
jgi:hypothetical protein